MKRLILALACASLVTIPGGAQQHPNQKKGFNANGVYQVNGLDTINAFNGNLTVSIPISGTYSVGGGLSYGLTLYSNANLWEAQRHCHPSNPGCITVCPRGNSGCAPGERVDPVFMYPHRRANAGLGWTLSFGRLYPPEHAAMPEQGLWTYESPDGADHVFDVDPYGAVSTTSDGSYLRMTSLADDPFTTGVTDPVRKIELPDGTVQYFQPRGGVKEEWDLRRITNQFPLNYLNITYGPVPDQQDWRRWTLEDSHGRQHFIDFQPFSYDGESRLLVKKVHLSQFGTDTKATVTFNYASQTLNRGEFQSCTLDHDPPDWPDVAWQTAQVQTLSSVALPDGLGYNFTYNSSGLNYAGVLGSMTVPAGGKLEWTYGAYAKPAASATGEEFHQVSYGVYTRKLWGKLETDGTRDPEGTWTYQPFLDCREDPQYPTEIGYCLEFTNTITGPLTGSQGSKTVHYFSVAKQNEIAPWKEAEYGLPFTKKIHDNSPDQRWLSSRMLKLDGTPLRSTYVRYDSGVLPDQMTKKRVVYDDHSGNYMDTYWSDWDNFGHYRTVRTNGSILNTPERITTTNYLGIAAGAAWNTGLFDSVTVTENGKTSRTDYCFEPATGFLKRKRTRKDAAVLGTTDLLVELVPDARGNVEWERYYGGDVQSTLERNAQGARPVPSVTTSNLCTAAPGSVVYEIRNQRTEPTATTPGLATSKYTNVEVFMSDVTIDSRTGLVSKSRDTAGVETSFEYDWAGRILWEKPFGRAWTKYEYLTPSTDTITVSKVDPASPSEPLPWTKYKIDAFGRVIRETTALPGNAEAHQNTTYNALGWRTSVSQPGYANALTVFTHDALGRVVTVTAPDTSQTTYSYSGDTWKTRRSWIRTNKNSSNDTAVDTIERFDGYGRLVAVHEQSGPTSSADTSGDDVSTLYSYDMADRLVDVTMRKTVGPSPVQKRIFDYDGRGFLRWESQPEAGVTSYLYDAKGNIATRLQAGGGSQFDLDYFYDPASRLSRIEARNPRFGESGEPAFRTMKWYEYGALNVLTGGVTNLRRGKLAAAGRFNYEPRWDYDNDEIYEIKDVYAYTDAAGRLTSRSTTISRDGFAMRTVNIEQTYNSLDLVQTLKYPMCVGCSYQPEHVDRSDMTRTYDRGRLTSLSGFISSISYWPNGMRNVLQRSNGIADTQMVGEMARPASISFGTYRQCVKPVIISQPGNKTSTGSGNAVVLSVSATGTGPLLYDWYDDQNNRVGSTEQITVYPTQTREYSLYVTNSCGTVNAEVITVSMPGCTLPATGVIKAVIQPDRSWVLTPEPTAATARTYAWRQLPGTTVIGTGATYAVGALTQTTTFGLVITDSCGSSTETTVTISVPLTAPVLQATRVTNSQVKVEWTAVSGATGYSVERRSGNEWLQLQTNVQSPYFDNNVTASKTYAYRVVASGNGDSSPASNVDVATTMTFPAPVAGQPITPDAANGMLDAVNKVRGGAGLAALTWVTVLSPSDPLVGTGNSITARQIMACRARMNEALQALSVPVTPYTDPDIQSVDVRALHMTEVQQRAQ